jgi:predicted nucleic acid-binding protein
MIIFDATYLVVLLNPNAAPAKDRNGLPVSMFKERVEYLTADLNASGEQIGIPAPAMAEVLVRAGKGKAQFVAILSDRWRFQILPFDARAAIEASDLIALIKPNSQSLANHAKIKFDIQIVAIAKAEDASVIYADDEDIERYAKRWKIPVKRICDLPLPPPKEFPKIDTRPVGEQTQLFDVTLPLLQPIPLTAPEQSATPEGVQDDPKSESAQDATGPSAEAGNQHEANPAHPASIRGSDEGRTESETAGENTAKT